VRVGNTDIHKNAQTRKNASKHVYAQSVQPLSELAVPAHLLLLFWALLGIRGHDVKIRRVCGRVLQDARLIADVHHVGVHAPWRLGCHRQGNTLGCSIPIRHRMGGVGGLVVADDVGCGSGSGCLLLWLFVVVVVVVVVVMVVVVVAVVVLVVAIVVLVVVVVVVVVVSNWMLIVMLLLFCACVRACVCVRE